MRVFVAFEIDEDIRKKIKNKIEILKSLNFDKKIKFVNDKNLHITILFIGEINEKQPDFCEKISLLKEEIKKMKDISFDTKIREIGFFPNEKHPHVLWLGINDETKISNSVNKFRKKIQKEFKLKKDYDFKPHLTIGRIKAFNKLNETEIEKIKENLQNLIGENIKIKSASLFRTHFIVKEGKRDVLYEKIF